jgi:hypothetical protein
MRPLGQPAGHRRRVAVAHRPAQDGQREAVDLEVDDPGHVGPFATALAARDPVDDAQAVVLVVVRPEDHLQRDADRGDHERRQERPPEVVDREGVLEDVGGELQHQRVDGKHQEEAEREHEGQAKRRDERRQDRVEDRDDRGHRKRPERPLDVDAGEDRGRDQKRQAGAEPGDEQAERPEARAVRLPPQRLAVRGRRRHSACSAVRFSSFLAARWAFCSATFSFASV